MGIAIGILVRTVMTHHYYQIDNKVFKQLEGGSIGSDLIGEVARIFMLLWDQEFLNKLSALGIDKEMFKWYVDDIVIILLQLKPGLWYDPVENKLKENNDITTSQDATDVQTFNVFKSIADSINPNISWRWMCRA